MNVDKHSLRVLGTAKGELVVPADFNDPLADDVLAGFEGELLDSAPSPQK